MDCEIGSLCTNCTPHDGPFDSELKVNISPFQKLYRVNPDLTELSVFCCQEVVGHRGRFVFADLKWGERGERGADGKFVRKCEDGGETGLGTAACKGGILWHFNNDRPRVQMTQPVDMTPDTFPRLLEPIEWEVSVRGKDSSLAHPSLEKT